MDRRRFLGTLLGAGAALAAGPALLALAPTPAPLPPPVFWSSDVGTVSESEIIAIQERYIIPAVRAMVDAHDAELLRYLA